MEAMNIKEVNKTKSKLLPNESKNSLFITSEDKTYEEYSSLLHSMNKKKKKNIFDETDLSLTSKSRHEGLLPRIKHNVN